LHSFPLNDTSSYVIGHQGIISAYKQAIKTYELNGPSFFSQFLNEFLSQIVSSNNLMIYHVILILTDGEIHDMQETKNAIVELSKYPVSIIIVGLGNESFAGMEVLDGDKHPVVNSSG